MKGFWLTIVAVICTLGIVVVGFYYLKSNERNPEQDIPFEVDTSQAYEVNPQLLPNYPEEDAIVIPDQEQADTDPEFPGGVSALWHYIEKNRKMPAAARRAGISGKVYVTFRVSERGVIDEISVLKGLGFGCDEEAVRIMSISPKWKPAMKDEKFVSSRYSVPVYFGKPEKFIE